MTVSVWGLGHFTTLISVESGVFSLFLLRFKFSQVITTLVSVGEDWSLWNTRLPMGFFESHVLVAIHLACYCMFCLTFTTCWWSCALSIGLWGWWAVISDSNGWAKNQDLCAGQGSLLQLILEWVVFSLQVRLKEPSTRGAGTIPYPEE